MATGTVKWFNDAKGFGFIEPQGGGPDIFVHFSAIEMNGYRTLQQGALVSFELSEGDKGFLAQSIQVLDAASPPPAPVRPHIARPTLRVRAPQLDFAAHKAERSDRAAL